DAGSEGTPKDVPFGAPRPAGHARRCDPVVFFFQAEDGIRDGHVTGVQTCALPISRATLLSGGGDGATLPPPSRGRVRHDRTTHEIGRASCRERVSISGVAV